MTQTTNKLKGIELIRAVAKASNYRDEHLNDDKTVRQLINEYLNDDIDWYTGEKYLD